MQKDMSHVGLGLRRVPGDEHADAALERAGHGYFAPADERHFGPAESGPRGVSRERSVQVVGDREPDVADIVGPNAVQLHYGVEELDGGGVDRLRVVARDGRRAADAADRHQPLPAAASEETKARSASGRRSAGAAETASSA